MPTRPTRLFLSSLSVALVLPPAPSADESPANCDFYLEGYVWHDQNANEIWDNGEPPLPDWTVEFLDGAFTVQGTAVTDAQGYYLSPPCHEPWIRQVLQPGWTQSFPPNNGMHFENSVYSSSGEIFGDYDFGNFYGCPGFTKTYTLDADFYEGTLNTVITNSDQLELGSAGHPFEFAWIATPSKRSISKVSTITGDEVARYYTGPPSSTQLSPSRTIVDGDGNCWVANRATNGVASVTQILTEGGEDFNNNNSIETCIDINSDGVIEFSEMKPWGYDERVVRHYLVGASGDIGRGLAMDDDGFLWVGLWSSKRLVKLKADHSVAVYGSNQTPSYPPEEASVDVSPHRPYGLALSCNGMIYGSTQHQTAFEVDPLAEVMTQYIEHPGLSNYGVAADAAGIVWYGLHMGAPWALQWDPTVGVGNPALGWTTVGAGAINKGRGITVDFDGNIWLVNNDNANNPLSKYDASGNWLANYPTDLSMPCGVGVDKNGDIVVVDQGSSQWVLIDHDTGALINLPGPQTVASSGYTYSDFTGNLSVIAADKLGTWTVITDGGNVDLLWNLVDWNASVPANTSLKVEARVNSSLAQLATMNWTLISTPGPIPPTPGRYIETKVTMSQDQECGGPITPILYDLTVSAICDSCYVICPPDTTLLCDGPQGAAYAWAPPYLNSACDSLGYDTITCTPPSGSYFPPGQTTVVCTMSGPALDDVVCEFVVTVVGDNCFGPTPTGACCFADSCAVTTEADCQEQGGIYFGDGSACASTCEFSCLRPPQGMITWLPLDWTLGNVTPNLADASAGGTLVGGPPLSFGEYVNNSIHLNGSQYISVPSGPSTSVGTGDFSIDMWVNTTDVAGVAPILDKRDNNPALTGYHLYLNNGYPGLQLAYNGTWTNFALSAGNGGAPAFVADGSWHHVGVTVERFNPNGIVFYVDGAPVGSAFNPTAYAGSSLNTGVELRIGRTSAAGGGSNHLQGSLDEVELFNRKLSSSEMNLLWLADDSGKCREACYASDYVTCCDGTGVITLTICNYDQAAHVYSWGLTETTSGVNCTWTGPLDFSPASGTLVVDPGQCVNIPVTVLCPSSLNQGELACFQASIFNHDSGNLFGCTGSVRNPVSWCSGFVTGGAVAEPMMPIDPDVPGGTDVSVTLFHLEPEPGTVGLDYRIVPVGDDGSPSAALALNGLPPGTPVTGNVTVPTDGSTLLIPFTAEYASEQPLGHDVIRFELDDDMDMTLEPILELPVRAEPLALVTGLVGGSSLPEPGRPARLFQAAPNPFSSSGRIEFEITGEPQRVRLTAYDINGRRVHDILRPQVMEPGVHRVFWNGETPQGVRLASGVYFLKLEAGHRTESIKVVLTR